MGGEREVVLPLTHPGPHRSRARTARPTLCALALHRERAPAHVPTPPSAAQISAADALFATALRSDEPDGFGDFSDEFLENFGV